MRAEYGERAVLRAVLREGHLPEARFTWEPLERLGWPRHQSVARPTLVRRLLTNPEPLPDWPCDPIRRKYNHAPPADASVVLHGPFSISGGWWAREQWRDYYLAESHDGMVHWVYYDRRNGCWFCQGWVE